MKYVFLALLSLSIASDVSVDVYYAQSPEANTEVVVETTEGNMRITVDDYSYSGETSSWSGATAYVNVEGGDTTANELTVSYSTSTSTDYGTTTGSEYSSNSVYASSADGSYVSVSQSTSTVTDYQASSNSSEYVGASVYDASTGTYTYDYVSTDTYVTADQNGTDIYYETSASVEGVSYYEETEVYVDNASAQGYGESEFYLWVNAQAFVSNIFGGFLEAFLALSALAVAGFLVYRKIKQETVKRYNATVRPVEECSNYIRI